MYQLAAALIATVALAEGGDYNYKQQGADWGSMPGFETCGTGKEQSPIDLTVDSAKKGTSVGIISREYEDVTVAADADGIAIDTGSFKVPYTAGGFTLQFNEKAKSDWEPIQFHFHAPSEHTIGGEHEDLEMHLVHTEKGTGALGAVIGVFFSTSAGDEDNEFIEGLLTGGDLEVLVDTLYDTVDFSRHWNYEGSLTTPPCTEGIKWTVIEEVQPISSR